MVRVFVSYSHRQKEWVRDRLVPVLRAGGADVLFDERFRLGRDVHGEMDALQDQGQRHVLCLSADYLRSDPCRHEMERALAADPDAQGIALALRLDGANVPDDLRARLHGDFTDDGKPCPWKKLLAACDGDLGVPAPSWLAARDAVIDHLQRGASVNLLVQGDSAAWRPLVADALAHTARPYGVVDLEDPHTTTRYGLLTEIVTSIGLNRMIAANRSKDLAEFGDLIDGLPQSAILALLHFDLIRYRFGEDLDLFSTLRWAVGEKRKLVLLAQSRTPFATLLPANNPLSPIPIQTVALG